MAKQNKTDRTQRNRTMIAGVQKHNGPTVIVDGVTYAPADIAKALQGSIDATDATAAASGAFHQAVVAERAANAKGDGVYGALKSTLGTQYKSQPAVLAEYGIVLSSKQVPDAGTAAAAVEKRAATRAARHTLGPRQKQVVTGTVDKTTPATPVTAAQPSVTTPPNAK
jgi:hypothetical protein